jgi:HTH-type transcriptional regulator/antitoxin HigA
MDIRAIRTEADYDWALSEIAGYFDNEPKPGTAEAERFDVLAALIEAYETRYWPIEAADPIDAIRYRMETAGYSPADLARLLGSRPRASEILNRRRPLTMKMVYKLDKEWKIPAAALVAPYRLRTAAASRRRSHKRSAG